MTASSDEPPGDAATGRPLPDRETLATLLDVASDLVLLLDPSGRVLHAGAAVERTLGLPPGGPSTVDLAHCLHPEDTAEMRRAFRRTATSGDPVTTSGRVRAGDGSYRLLDVDLRRLATGPGHGTGVVVTARDRTQEQHARDAAEQVEEHLRALVDNSPVLVFALDAAGVITFARGRELADLGIDGDALVGRSIFGFGPGGERTADAVRRCLDGEEDVALVFELGTRLFDLRYRPRRVDGRVVGVLGVGTDITETVHALEQLRVSEARWRALVAAGSDAALVVDPDAVIRFMSPAGPTLFGWNPEDAIGRSAFEFVHPDDAAQLRAGFESVLADPGHSTVVEFRMYTPADEWRWAEVAIRNRLDDPTVAGVIGNIRDVSDRRRDRDRLAESEARYRLIVENTQDGIALVDADGTPTYVNDRLCELSGLSRQELLATSGREWVERSAHPVLELAWRRRQLDRRSAAFEVPWRRPDGEERHLLVTTTPLDPPAATDPAHQTASAPPTGPSNLADGQLVLVSDVTERRRAEAELARLTLHDALTGLPNRGLLLDRIGGALNRRRRHGGLVALLLLDVDQFQSVNDSVGAAGADDLLRRFTERLGRTVRAGDTVARLGSDEFAVLSEELAGDGEATLLADRLLSVLSEPVELPGPAGPVEAVVTASIGVALTASDTMRPDDLLQRAEVAVHRAKLRGRACYDVLSDAGEQQSVDRLRVVNELRSGLRRGELELHYQPLVELATGRVVGAEALARWRHPERGLLGPEEFIGLAEGSGLIRDLGAWVLRTACQQATDVAFQRTTAPGLPLMAVNLSMQQLADPNLAELVATVLADTGLPPHRLMLEVTETALLADTDAALNELQALRRLGVQLALDDFGTGFSSLTYLKRFPLHELKIDRSFVSELSVDPASDAIVASVVQLARAIGLSVVAEGVETEQQRQDLLGLGCTLGQGFLFGRPVPAERFVGGPERRP